MSDQSPYLPLGCESLFPDYVRHLLLLQEKLTGLGLKSNLDTRAAVPRLRILSPLDQIPEVAEFENSIVVAMFGHDCWYAWPWAEPISRITEVARAASEICEILGDQHEIADVAEKEAPHGRATLMVVRSDGGKW